MSLEDETTPLQDLVKDLDKRQLKGFCVALKINAGAEDTEDDLQRNILAILEDQAEDQEHWIKVVSNAVGTYDVPAVKLPSLQQLLADAEVEVPKDAPKAALAWLAAEYDATNDDQESLVDSLQQEREKKPVNNSQHKNRIQHKRGGQGEKTELAVIMEMMTAQNEQANERMERMMERLDLVEKREVTVTTRKEKPLALPEEELREYDAESYLPYCRRHGMELLDIRLKAYFRVPTTELGKSSAGILRTGMYSALKETISMAAELDEGGDIAWSPLLTQHVLNMRNHIMECDPNARAKPDEVYGEMFARIKPGDAFGQAAYKVAQKKKGQVGTKPRGPVGARPQHLRCYNCGGEGHMARMCTKPKNVQPASQK
jgi:hypothetical protein